MKKLVWLLFSLLIFISPVKAQTGGERIDDFSVQMNVRKDGVVEVVESIKYNFGSLQRHGIFRNIPYIKTNEEGKKFRLAMRVDLVIDETGKKYKFSEANTNGQIQLKIGDPDEYVTGQKTYVIAYEVKGALSYFSDHDELYWNVTGNGWTVPITKAKANIILPDDLDDRDVKMTCFTGAFRSTTSDCEFYHSARESIYETTKNLGPGEGLTVVLGFRKNIVSVLEPTPYTPFWERWYGKLLLGLIFVVVGGAVLFWYIVYPLWIVIKWFKYGRDPRVPYGPVTAWYSAPKSQDGRELTPAEVGTLIDEYASQREISAMIVDLARRGYLMIEERKKKDFYFHKKTPKKADKLQPFEKDLLDSIFTVGDSIVRVKDLKLVSTVSSVKEQLYNGLVSDGFFPKNPNTVRAFYYVMGILALATANLHTAIIAFVFGHLMPRKTPFGAEAANMAKSLKNFLVSQERQLKFQASKQIMFEKLLPYAVAFGVEEIWAERFKDLGIKQPDWYTTHDGTFTTTNFTRSLNSSFASVTRAATPTSSSSGFSSGFSGGSSGGGGGGGGGGSW